MSEHNLISVDLAKIVFQLCAMTDRMLALMRRSAMGVLGELHPWA